MSDADELEEIRQQKIESIKDDESGGESGGSAGAPDEPIHISGPDHLQEVADSYGVVLVDFYADWCGPCKMIEPVVAALAEETEAAVAKVDVDALQQLAAQYQVQGVPTLMLFSDGEMVERMTGARQRPQLEQLIEQYS
ncbi:MAG: thioredoxin [Haloarculaceae archaeon]